MTETYLTQEKFKELTEELARLKKEGRQSLAKRLKFAKELGDLSENTEYKLAREEQANLEKRIAEVEHLLNSARIIQKQGKGSKTVQVGSQVKLLKGGKEVVYTIVGSNEANPLQGKISNESPLGRQLLGKREKEKIKVATAKGEVNYTIKEIF